MKYDTGLMDSEQARLTQIGAALIGAMLRDDEQGIAVLFDDAASEPRLSEAILFVAIVAADTWCIRTGRPQDAVADLWPLLPPPRPPFHQHADRDGISALATAVRTGAADELARAQNHLSDTGRIMISAADLAIAAVESLTAVTDISGEQWCRLWAQGAAGGVGIDR